MGALSINNSCAAAALFLIVSNVLRFTSVLQHRNRVHFDYDAMIELDPDFIMDEFEYRLDKGNMMLSGSFFSCLSMILLLVPIVKVAYIQYSVASKQYTNIHSLGLHITIVALAMSATISECIAGVLQLGTSVAADWIAIDFALDDWLPAATNVTIVDDMIGWKTLSMISIVTDAMLLWVDALAYFFLFIIFVLIFVSVRTTNNDTTNVQYFKKTWAYFGMMIGALCLIDFISSVLRLQTWRKFTVITLLISVVNSGIFIPVWLLWLGKQIVSVEETMEMKLMQDNNNNTNNSVLSPLSNKKNLPIIDDETDSSYL